MLVVYPEEDVSDDELVGVGGELEVGAEGGVAGAAPHRGVSLRLQELGQLRPGAVVPHQVRSLRVGVK